MTTRARQHFLRTRAARLQPAVVEADTASDTAHESVLRALATHKSRLKSIASVEAKIEYKRKVLPELLPWVEGVIAGDRGSVDPVVSHVLPWLLDVGDYARALIVGEYVLRHRLPMPDEYSRPPAAVIAEIIADDALKALDTNGDAPVVDVLNQAIQLTCNCDMHDQVRAKLHKAIGLALLPSTLPATYGEEEAAPVLSAHEHLARAYKLSPAVGVKKPLEKAQRYINEYSKRRAKAGDTPKTTESAGKTGAKPGVEVAGPAPAESGDGGKGQPPPPAPDAAP